MADVLGEVLPYKRNHFSARFPVRYLYCPSHFWLFESSPGHWRVGMTSFATRMLGDIVEFDFEVKPGGRVQVGEAIGWIEGFKAVSDVYSAVEGEFAGSNAEAADDVEAICKDPYGRGWLYSVRGDRDARATDIDGYVAYLDRTIDKMLEQPWRSEEIGRQ